MKEKAIRATNTGMRVRRNTPISIRRVEIRGHIWPPEPVTHVGIDSSRSILLHSRNVGPFG
jgi:hypothetical protein